MSEFPESPRRKLFPAFGALNRFFMRHSRSRSDAARGFDLAWVRWLLSLLIVAFSIYEATQLGEMDWISFVLGSAFALLLVVYFGHLFIRRMQCSFLEFALLIAVMGTMQGLIFSLPGFSRMPKVVWPLCMLLGAWLLNGAVIGLVQARLLRIERGWKRAGLFLAAWLGGAAPALILGAGLLAIFRHVSRGALVSDRMSVWMVPLFIAGGAGLVLGTILDWRAGRAARVILGERSSL